MKHKTKMKEYPILFSTQMVRAILDGTKTQTRRPIPVMPKENQSIHHIEEIDKYCFVTKHENGKVSGISEYFRRPYNVGDRLWVRETYRPIDGQTGELISVDYKADPPEKWERLGDVVGTPVKWRPSIHMPRSASRLTLAITDIRAEPLPDISDEDAIREGIYRSVEIVEPCESKYPISTDWDGYEAMLPPGVARCDFARMWRSIYPNGPKSWDMAPWVWVIDFEVVK